MTRTFPAALLALVLACAPAARGADKSPDKAAAPADKAAANSADKAADVTDMQMLRTVVQQDKKSFVASTLNLTDAEGKKFWPIYDTYQRALDGVDRRRNKAVIEIVGMDRPMSDPYARSLANELIQTDEAEIKARRTLQNRLMRALPPRKAARYLQLESKIRAVEAYEVAAALPLVR
jgi:Spy/CpxP family protein refolding chaperone